MVKGLRPLRVTIDGPAGAGKSTVARQLAKTLGYVYVDTGAMYRAITLKVLEAGISPDDHAKVVSLAQSADIRLVDGESSNGISVLMDGRDVTKDIRSPIVNANVSQVSAIAGVRALMVSLQRRLAQETSVVMEGRDIGSVVLPDAEVKIYLDASQEERARRRVRALAAIGFGGSYEEALAEVISRDRIDSSREVAPLIRPQGAVVIDSTQMPVDQVVLVLADIVKRVSDQHVLSGS